VDPNTFGYGDTVGGVPNIRGNLVRDIAYLNKVEVLGWDFWGLIEASEEQLDSNDLDLLDQAAHLSQTPSQKLNQLRELYIHDLRLRVPPLLKRSLEDSGFKTEDILEGQPSMARYL
jgi:hypothetical protein